MKLYLIKNNWRGERYVKQEDGIPIVAFESIEDAKDHIEWETEGFPEAEKEMWRERLEIVEIDVPFVRGIDR